MAMRSFVASSLLFSSLASSAAVPLRRTHDYGYHDQQKLNVQVGNRPEYLVHDMDEGPLKDKLMSCSEGPFSTSDFVFAHRGAPLQFPEHTVESYTAARRQGAGVIECDVAFTKDKQLVCRHAQCDLHTTTNILNTPLAAKCSTPFTPASVGPNGTISTEASAECCTSDITLAEFKSLCGKMDGANPNATTVAEYMDGTPDFRTDLYSTCGTLQTLDEYIALVDSWHLKFTAELKTPAVPMPFEGTYTQAQYAQDMIDAFKARNISSSRVWPQSFLPDDIFYWLEHAPDFGARAVYLDERVDTPAGYAIATASLPALAARGVNIVAPAMFALTELDAGNNIVPSAYAIAAKEAGLDLVAWSFERTGPLADADDYYYYDFVKEAINNDGDMYTVLDVLARDVGIKAMFSDWPATVTYYANCWGL